MFIVQPCLLYICFFVYKLVLLYVFFCSTLDDNTYFTEILRVGVSLRSSIERVFKDHLKYALLTN